MHVNGNILTLCVHTEPTVPRSSGWNKKRKHLINISIYQLYMHGVLVEIFYAWQWLLESSSHPPLH